MQGLMEVVMQHKEVVGYGRLEKGFLQIQNMVCIRRASQLKRMAIVNTTPKWCCLSLFFFLIPKLRLLFQNLALVTPKNLIAKTGKLG